MPLLPHNRKTVNPILSLKNVYFSYPQVEILRDVSLDVYPGEYVGIIGPNGGGKTTLLKLILGFLYPSKGSVHLFGKFHKRGFQDKIAYVPQNIRFDRDFPISVEEVVLGGILSHLPWYGFFNQQDKDRVHDALKRTRLEHLKTSAFGTLSGGQAQRVLIARALVSNPKLLLLDEPTASVDHKSKEEIYSLLDELKKEMAILQVTHDLEIAAKKVDRLFCVQLSVTEIKPEDICCHTKMGLYS